VLIEIERMNQNITVDIEAPVVAVPVTNTAAPSIAHAYAYTDEDSVLSTATQTVPATMIYVTERAQYDLDQNSSLLPCAIFGFLFSWIPLIGIINYLVNMNAPRSSTRSMIARSSCWIATVVIFFNLIFWSAYRH
jgi:hypothetical protein